MNRLKLGVVGVGALGRHHARILGSFPDVELVAVAEPNEAQGRSVAEATGCEWVADYQSLLGRVDAASIVVPTFLHQPVAVAFLERGIPVLVEKPIASSLAAGQAIVDAAAASRVAVQVGHIERFNPAFRALAERVQAPRYIRAERYSNYAFRSMDIGVVHDLMIHDIELTQYLVQSEVISVEAFGVSLVGGHEDAVQARVRFENGCLADLSANRVCPTATRTMQVWSARGCVTADLHTRTVTTYGPRADLRHGPLPYDLGRQPGADINQLKAEMFTRFIPMETPTLESADALTMELRSFIESVRNGTMPEVDGVAGLKAIQVADAILKSVATHSWGPGDGLGPHVLLDRLATASL
ncbi:MAG: gfo/Idh/MocA family oxidoreductase [Planctomycetota bacterium]|nr:MAG: gfo/Idh/MocA family oxidoreductase [Planctomycetota bacterium]